MNAFPTRRPAELAEQPQERRWLVEQLWSEQAVGIIGGEPKCGKSFLALDLAVAVATGTPCLRRFPAASGRVLLFAAEDAAHVVRERLDGIARAAGTSLDDLDIDVIDVPAVRLDLANDRQRLFETVRRIRPRLLVLDPLVRLHRIDENAAAEVAPLLACLRDLQRNFDAAVVLVHHARKSAHARGGQALRGSSELHAWGDSNLYLRRKKHRILLTVEHRASKSPDEIALRETPIPSLQIVEAASEAPTESPRQRVENLLADTPLSQRQIRDAAHMRASTVSSVLKELVSEGRVAHTPDGYCIAS